MAGGRMWSRAGAVVAAVVSLVFGSAMFAVQSASATTTTVTIDLTGTSLTHFYLAETAGPNPGPVGPGDCVGPPSCPGEFAATSVQTITLDASADYIIQPGSGIVMDCALSVDASGDWSYPASCDGFIDPSSRGTSALEVTGYAVDIDATPISGTITELSPLWSGTAFPTSSVQTLRLVPLEAGSYTYQPGSGLVSACTFGIDTATGDVTLDAASEPCESASGNTLTINGFPITFDPRPLSTTSYVWTWFGPPGLHPSNTTYSLTLLPLSAGQGYGLQVGSGVVADFTFNVDASTGDVTYDSSLALCASGAGTTSVTLDGCPITIDATLLGAGQFNLDYIFIDNMDQSVVQHLSLLPGQYGFASGQHGSFDWVVGRNGDISLVSGPSEDDSCVSGRGRARSWSVARGRCFPRLRSMTPFPSAPPLSSASAW